MSVCCIQVHRTQHTCMCQQDWSKPGLSGSMVHSRRCQVASGERQGHWMWARAQQQVRTYQPTTQVLPTCLPTLAGGTLPEHNDVQARLLHQVLRAMLCAAVALLLPCADG